MLIQLMLFRFAPSRTAAKVISYIIQQNYKSFIKTFKDVQGDDREHWFQHFQVYLIYCLSYCYLNDFFTTVI